VADAGRRALRAALILASIQVGLSGLTLAQRRSNADWVSVAVALAATTVLILFSTYCLLGYVLRARRITRDQLHAGVCTYLMLGFASARSST
jgi:hypothetical protein